MSNIKNERELGFYFILTLRSVKAWSLHGKRHQLSSG